MSETQTGGRLAQVIATRGGTAPPEAPFVIEHREALIYMLCEAAELEHGIMCQYLYAVFSLKQSRRRGPDAPKRHKRSSAGASASATSPRRRCCTWPWCRTCCRPSAVPRTCPGRTSRMPATHYPAGVHLALLPFGEAALQHFMYLERPEGMDLNDAEGLAAFGRAAPAMQQAISSPAARTSRPSGTCTGRSRPGSRTWPVSSASGGCSSARRGPRPPSSTSAGPNWSR